MQPIFKTTIFQEEFNSIQNWKTFDLINSTISTETANLIFKNKSPNLRSIIYCKVNFLPPNSNCSFEIEAKIKFGKDLDKRQPLSLVLGSSNLEQYYKLSINQFSWTEITERKKKHFFAKPNTTSFFNKKTDFELFEDFNCFKIQYDSENKLIKYFINDNFIFNNLYSGFELKHVGLECGIDGSLIGDSIEIRI